MVEFNRDAQGPGQVIDRTGESSGFVENLLRSAVQSGADDPQIEGALHPFSPRVWAANHQTRLADQRAVLGFDVNEYPWKEENRSASANSPVMRNLLLSVFDRLSDRLAGGSRISPEDLAPENMDPGEGEIPEDMLKEIFQLDFLNPDVFNQIDPENIDLELIGKLSAASGPGKEGKGLDWFRSGEAPNNYANRNNPLYKARAEFAKAIAPQIEEMFGVSAQGSAGHLRAPSSGDAAPGGRSANSDHYAGGAIDFFGTQEERIALRNWAIQQPWVSFVRCESESHYDHDHISIDVGWIAENFYKGRKVPQLDRRTTKSRVESRPMPSASGPSVTRNRPSTPGGSGGVQEF